jgi:hypothetical protein
MQREKLYNLNSKAYCNYIAFGSKRKQNCVRLIFANAKTDRANFALFSTQ